MDDQPLIKHNWLYSVVPLFTTIPDETGGIFLVGYCKQCDSSFTKRLPVNRYATYPIVERADIPKWGCQPIE